MVKVNPSIIQKLPLYDRTQDRKKSTAGLLDDRGTNSGDVVKISDEAVKKHIVGRLKARISEETRPKE